jgi:ABC-type uncharacterized transport system ATPase subunit
VLRRIHADRGKSLLIATHRFEEATRLCEAVVVIDKGRIAGRESLAGLKGRGASLADYYRGCLCCEPDAHAQSAGGGA